MFECSIRYGGTHVPQWLDKSELKSEDPGFDSLAGRVRFVNMFFFCPSESTLVQTGLCLALLREYGTHPILCAR